MVYTYKSRHGVYELTLTREEYGNGRLAIQAWEKDGPFGTISVNLPDEDCPKGHCFIDTNNMPEAARFLIENGIGEDTGDVGFSGFCVYPLFKIDESKLEPSMMR